MANVHPDEQKLLFVLELSDFPFSAPLLFRTCEKVLDSIRERGGTKDDISTRWFAHGLSMRCSDSTCAHRIRSIEPFLLQSDGDERKEIDLYRTATGLEGQAVRKSRQGLLAVGLSLHRRYHRRTGILETFRAER